MLERLTYFQPHYTTASRPGQISTFQGMWVYFVLKSQKFATVFSATPILNPGSRPRDHQQILRDTCSLFFETTDLSLGWPSAHEEYVRAFTDLQVYIKKGHIEVSAALHLTLYEYGSEKLWEGLEDQHQAIFGEYGFRSVELEPLTRFRRVIEVE